MRIDSPSVARISSGRARKMRALSWGLVVVSILLPMIAFATGSSDLLMGAFTLAAPIFVIAVAISASHRGEAVAGQRHRGRAMALEVGGESLRLGDETFRLADETFRASDVIEGFREEYGERHQVILQLARETLAIETTSAEDADAILDAMGVGAFQRAVTLQIGAITSPIARAAIAITGAIAALISIPLVLVFVISFASVVVGVTGWDWAAAGLTFVLMCVGLGAFLGAARLLGVRTLRIGRDGVAVKLGLAPSSFVPFRGMTLERKGRVLDFQAGVAHATLPTTGVPEAIALARRVEEARSAYDSRAAVRAELLSRQGRPLDAWRESIRKLASIDNYREGIGRDDLLAIVEDPSALPDERIAAASALGALPDEPRVKKRLGAAIATTAEPRLRVALERAVEGVIEEASLEEAIRR